MKSRLTYFLKYYAFWLVFFVLQKPIFLVWQHALMGDITGMDYLRVIGHGLPLDASVAAYCTALVGLWLAVSVWWRSRAWQVVVDVYTGLMVAIGLSVLLGDNGCFPSWGYHLDKTVGEFLRTPKEVLACAPTWVWFCGAAAFGVLWIGCMAAAWGVRLVGRRVSPMYEVNTIGRRVGYSLALLVVTGLLFLPMRGSVSVSTMNTGRVYFSDNQMLNMAAINPVFNIVESLGENTFDVDKYTYMSGEEASATVDSLYSISGELVRSRILTTARPNIVLLILESFSLNAWDAMPRIQQLAEEGVLFTNMFASSFRTDRGVVAVMSGFPGQPTSSLMTVPYKSKSLPQLGGSLRAVGYETAFYYGGDEDFTNMRSYLISGGFEDRISDHSFAMQDRLSKWGVPDHILMQRAGREIVDKLQQAGKEQKRLDVILSLSSHEPFEVPYHHLEHPYLNSIAYTDSCVGALVDTLRASADWDSLLVVMVADHGFPYPEGLGNYEPLRYRIPMVLCGGAVKEPMKIETLCSQIDIVPTLLSEMELPTDAYWFGKDILDSRRDPFAFYAFHDGFALIKNQDTIVVDAKANQVIRGENKKLEHVARAMVQRVMEVIDKL